MSEVTPVRENTVFAPGDVIERKYRILRLLAEGGMGSVYHAVQEPLGREVAVKVLKPMDETADKREQRHKRFFREASFCSRLNHPNTIMIFDYGELENKDGFFLVMEYLEGGTLRDLIAQRGALDLRTALGIGIQMAGSLADAHQAGVIHRDLKPPNIMLVQRDGNPHFVKVVDFGLVKQLGPGNDDEELTAENTIIGSPMYMAPERFMSKNADSPSVDIYAMGIMLYEMIVGRPPFIRDSEATIHQLIMQHIQADPPAMRSLRPDLELPEGLEALIMRCLAKQPEQRIDSMDTLAALLRSCERSLDHSITASGPGGAASLSTNRSRPFMASGATQDAGSRDIVMGEDTGPGTEHLTGENTRPLLPSTIAAAQQATATAERPVLTAAQPESEPRKRSPLLPVVALCSLLAISAIAIFMMMAPPPSAPDPPAAAENATPPPAADTPRPALEEPAPTENAAVAPAAGAVADSKHDEAVPADAAVAEQPAAEQPAPAAAASVTAPKASDTVKRTRTRPHPRQDREVRADPEKRLDIMLDR